MSAEMAAGDPAPKASARITSAQRRRDATAQQWIEAQLLGTETEIRADRPRRLPASSSDLLTQMERVRARRRARVLVDRRRSAGLR